LRGRGDSQGAFGAVDQKGNPLPALADERYKISDRRITEREIHSKCKNRSGKTI
jgi:hypothetical protein